MELPGLTATEEFKGWSLNALRVLRTLADGATLNTPQIEERARAMGMHLSYQTARQGCRWLLDNVDKPPPKGWYCRYAGREYGTWQEPVEGAFAIESIERTPKGAYGKSLITLTELGQGLAARAVELLGVDGEEPLEPPAAPRPTIPPDPLTPVWRVLTENNGLLVVVARDRPRAIELAGDTAVRVEPIDTSAEQVVKCPAPT